MNEFQTETLKLIAELIASGNEHRISWAKQIAQEVYEDDPTDDEADAMDAEFRRLKLDI